ncbi:MAG TPA: peptidoglycan-associated lipoprotein Pal [Candidatus Binataceae bacterium]|nr:peptidoglycan-associated lipoprotein Pal [Candidatus Binataceae bacterium]
MTSAAGVARIAALAMICVALSVAGCSSKKPEAIGTGVPVGDQGNQTKSTIEDYSKTGMIAGEGGPLSDIHFGYNDYTVQPQDSSILRQNASWLQAHSDANVQVEGNCDERGSEEYNIALGAKRAQSAKDYLTTLGISPGRISTISYGKELQVCQEHEESCWQRNRRDHFVVSGGQSSR